MGGLFTGEKKLYFIIPLASVGLLLAIWVWSVSPDTVFRIIRYNFSGIENYCRSGELMAAVGSGEAVVIFYRSSRRLQGNIL